MGLLAVFLPRSCADQLAGMFTFIFNESLSTSVVSSLSIFVFIKSTVYGPAHFILYLLFFTYIYVYSLVLVLHVIALSIERTCSYLSFTADYILYNWVCDE